MNPLISIVTVSLNAEATIEDTLVSVSLQRRSFDIEHICVDGGSTDRTRDVVDAWALRTGHIERIYERDHGIFDAMNKGLRAAKGEYVFFLNADDFLVAPDTLAKAMDATRPGGEGNPDLIVGDVSMGVIGGHGLWRHRRAPRLLARVRGTGLFPIHQGLFAKRLVLERAGGYTKNVARGSPAHHGKPHIDRQSQRDDAQQLQQRKRHGPQVASRCERAQYECPPNARRNRPTHHEQRRDPARQVECGRQDCVIRRANDLRRHHRLL